MRPMGASIRGQAIKVVLVEAVVVFNLEVTVLMVDILCIHSISLRVSLIEPFRQCFRLLMEVSLVAVITLIRVVVCL